MGIYIKGMELPTDCHNCPLGFGGGCYFGTSADEYMCPDHGRAEWCPLVPVPPHGDLIDRGVLAAEFWDGQAYFTDAIKRKINGAPTVIPADMEAPAWCPVREWQRRAEAQYDESE